jgi:Zn-dependent protease with chaperone function
MNYENPQIREGINVADTHPLVEFGGLLASVALLCATVFGTAYLLAGWLLPYVPFSTEEFIVENIEDSGIFEQELTPEAEKIQAYLQALAEKLAAAERLPEGMTLRVRYSTSEQKNAFASLAGYIVINQGLLDAVQSENGLAMVLGHEIGHIAHRDPLMSLGRGVVTLGALAIVSGFSESGVADSVFGLSARSVMLGFSREQERDADSYGLRMLQNYYGHLGGADEFFSHILKAHEPALIDSKLAEFFTTHPGLEERIATIRASSHGKQGSVTPLPTFGKSE